MPPLKSGLDVGGAALSGDVKLSNETANRLHFWALQDNPHAFGVAPFCKGESFEPLKQTGSRIGSPNRLQVATALLMHVT